MMKIYAIPICHCYSRARKFQAVLMYQTWHWVSGLGTNSMINVLITFLCRVQISIKKTIFNILLSTTITTNNTIYFFSKIKTGSGCSFWTKYLYHFQNNSRFSIFAHIKNSNLGRVLEQKSTYDTNHNLKIFIQQSPLL